MKKIFFFLLGCLAFQLAPQANAAFFDPAYNVRTIKTEHFYIHYPKEVSSVAEDLVAIVEQVHDNLSVKMKWTPWGRTHVVLVDKTDSANGLATVIPANYMLLYVAPPEADSSLDNYKNYLELLFTHEYTHILHIDQHYKMADPFHWIFGKIVAPNGLTPGWMREGIAAWNESTETGRGRGNGSYGEMMMRTAILENTFPKIDQAAGLGRTFPGADAAYMYGVKFFMWLQDKFGAESIQKYSEKYASGIWLFSLNNKAKRVFGKSFYQLWDDWQADLKTKYQPQIDELTRKGLTPLEKVESGADQFRAPTTMPGSDGYAYVDVSLDDSTQIIIKQTGKEPVKIKRAATGQMSFSRDGGSLLAYAAQAGVERYHVYSEVYVYDLAKSKIRRLAEKGFENQSLRASDPDFGPMDGGNRWVVMVRTNLGTDNLYAYDIATHKGYYLTAAAEYTQFSNPRYSPDGSQIVVSRKLSNGNRDLVLYTNTGTEIRVLTQDEANDNHPIWADNNTIYFDSDKSGIVNIYQISKIGGEAKALTNVLTGVFKPQIARDGRSLLVEHFTSSGFDISRLSLSGQDRAAVKINSAALALAKPTSDLKSQIALGLESLPDADLENENTVNTASATALSPNFYFEALSQGEAPPPIDDLPGSSGGTRHVEDVKVETKPEANTASAYATQLEGKPRPEENFPDILGSTKYNAFPQVLVPRYIVPTFATLDDSFLFGFATGRFDPLYRHNWNAGVNYRSDASFLGASASYAYTRFKPTFFFGANRYAVNWGDLFGTGVKFFEQRLGGYIGVAYPMGHHQASLNYFYENRDNLSAIPAGFSLPTLDRYAGVHFRYLYSRYKQFPNSISQEKGPFFKLDLDWSNSVLGSSEFNEQIVLSGDLRYYFEMPWSDHHVFALRAAGGYVWGDQEFSGSFRFGGPFGEGALAGYSSRLYPFRGLPGVTYAADRVALFSAEYRIPLMNVERGIGTWPVFLNNLHLALFTDYGDSWGRNGKDNVGFFDDFFLSVGTELRTNVVIGYGLPVTARLGYAIILNNRDQLAGFQDSTFGMDVRNGTVYFQFGTSF